MIAASSALMPLSVSLGTAELATDKPRSYRLVPALAPDREFPAGSVTYWNAAYDAGMGIGAR
jgi:hypothetical protein